MATAVNDARINSPADRWRGDDFAAWLPSMLVKELRQGVQSGGFFWTFLIFQVALFLLFTQQALVVELFPQANRVFTVFFWLAVVAAVAVIVPLRGLGAVSGERRGNAIDLLRITRLSATRIVLGKWAALVAQSCLLTATLLPYVVIRYFFGGLDVLADLRGLGWVLAAAAFVAAAAVALSTLPLWMRIGFGLVMGWAGFMLFAAVMNPGAVFVWGSGFGSWQVAVGLLATLAVYTAALLAFATARIAPPAENHSLRLRLLALGAAAAWPLAGWLASEQAAIATFVATGPLLLAVAVGSLLEKPRRVRTLFARFRRAGPLGRLAATLLAPGWAAGLVCVAIMAAACLAGLEGCVERFGKDKAAIAYATLLVAAIIYPLPFTALPSRVRYPLLLYGLVQILCFTVFVFADAFKGRELWADYSAGYWITAAFPLAAAAALQATDGANATASTIAGLVVIGAVLVVMARPWLREIAAGDRLVRRVAGTAPPATAVAARRPTRKSVARWWAAADRPWAWRGDDFPGWLSPMLVRELRQGVQSGIFAWTFIGIQAAMFAVMTGYLSVFDGSAASGTAQEFSSLFWAAVALAIVVVVPLRGLAAVSGERVAGNLDLVRLTRLSATRIVVGKWAALVGQGLLVATTILPYLVLRYFFGAVNVLADLEVFGWMVIGSMVVAAAAIALSTLPLWLRIGILIVAGIVGFVPAVAIVGEVARGRSMPGVSLGLRLGLVAGLALHVVALLAYAAARIAPPAENHAGRMRLIALAAAAAWAVVGPFGDDYAFFGTILVTGPLLLCYTIGALLERPVPISAIHRPFGRWGWAGRLAAAMFTPGWATAVPFVTLVAGLCMMGWLAHFAAMVRFDRQDYSFARAFGCLLVAALLFPLPVTVRLPQVRPRFVLYALVQGVCLAAFFVLLTMASRHVWMSSGVAGAFEYWGGWVLAFPLPLTAMCVCMMHGPTWAHEWSSGFVFAAAVTTLVVLGLVAGPWLAEMRRTMRLVRGGSPPTRPVAEGGRGHEPA